MSETGGWAARMGEFHIGETDSARAIRLAGQQEQRADREAARAEAARAAALQERHELLQVAALNAGVAGRTAGEVIADAGRMGDEDAEYSEAQRTIQRIDRRRANRRRDLADQAERMAGVTGLVSRSATTDDPLAGVNRVMAAAHREFASVTRAKMNAAAAGGSQRQGRHPFFGGGEARRSELECWYCLQNNVSHEDSTLLHLDPQSRVPITSREQAEADQAEHADRSGQGGRTPMIHR